MNPRYPAVAERASHRCEYCHAPEAVFNLPFEVEHIVPPGRGGDDETANLALACRACNLYKADHLTGDDPQSNAARPLFNPRRDVWDEHFLVNAETGEISGRTPVGRATIVRLRLNSPVRVESRRLWRQLRLSP